MQLLSMKKILVTGASGLLATEVIHTILNKTNFSIDLVSRNPILLQKRYRDFSNRIKCYTLEQIIKVNEYPLYESIVHTAFSRTADGAKLAESLDYTFRLCQWVKKGDISQFINISSQSIYGSNYTPKINERGRTNPSSLYALAKYSSELIVKASLKDINKIKFYNIRLASICENARFLRIFVEKVITELPIEVIAPDQNVSFIDVRDAAMGILRIIETPQNEGGDYNLGSGEWYTILDIAKRTIEIGKSLFGYKGSEIIIDDKVGEINIGMDVQKFKDTFHWNTIYTIDNMIESIYNLLTNNNRGGYSNILSIKNQNEKNMSTL